MKKILVCLLVICFTFSFDASAYIWTYVGKESDGTRVYLDESSVRVIDDSRKSFFIKIEDPNKDTYPVISAIMDKDEKRAPGNLSFGSAEIYRKSDNTLLGRNDSHAVQPVSTGGNGVLGNLYDLVWGKETRDEVAFKNGFIGGVGKAISFFLIGAIGTGITYLWRKLRRKSR